MVLMGYQPLILHLLPNQVSLASSLALPPNDIPEADLESLIDPNITGKSVVTIC